MVTTPLSVVFHNAVFVFGKSLRAFYSNRQIATTIFGAMFPFVLLKNQGYDDVSITDFLSVIEFSLSFVLVTALWFFVALFPRLNKFEWSCRFIISALPSGVALAVLYEYAQRNAASNSALCTIWVSAVLFCAIGIALDLRDKVKTDN